MAAFGKLVFSFFLGVLIIASRSWAIVLLWRWFAQPTFHLPSLTWRLAYGLSMLVWLISASEVAEHEDNSYKAVCTRAITRGVISPWIFVGMGWLVK